MEFAWHPVRTGPVTCADWAHWLQSGSPIDPYMVWADLTQLAGYGQSFTSSGRWPILVQMAPGTDNSLPSGCVAPPGMPAPECHPALGLLEIPGVYGKKNENSDLVTRRFDYLTASVSPSCVEELLKFPELVKRFQLGIPRIPAVDTNTRPVRLRGSGQQERVVVGVIDDGFAFANSMFCAEDGITPRTCFLWDQDAATGAPRGKPWRPLTTEFGYGAELHHDDIVGSMTTAAAAAAKDASSLKELRVYEALDYVPRRPHPDQSSSRRLGTTPYQTSDPLGTVLDASHGTSVAALAAGARLTLPAVHDAQGQWPADQKDFDTSDAWPLIMVQLPTRTTLDSSGGSLGVHILDGLHYIIRRAQSIEPGGKPSGLDTRQPFIAPSFPKEDLDRGKLSYRDNIIVVSISYGAVAGPHDGTSILEEAIGELVGAKANSDHRLWVVLAAGNAHGSKTNCRTELREDGEPKVLTWSVGPDNLLEAYLEIWFPDCDSDAQELDLSLLDKLQIEVKPPAGMPTLKLKRGEGHFLTTADSTQPIAAAIFSKQVAQGMRGTMLLLTSARTRRGETNQPHQNRPAAALAPHGSWQVTMLWGLAVTPATKRSMVVHAWAERNDQLWGQGRRQQSTVVGEDPVPSKTEFSPTVREFCSHGSLRGVTEEVPRPFQAELSGGSLSQIPEAATDFEIGRRAASVGGLRLSDGEMASYSASGTSRSSVTDLGPLPGGDCVSSPAQAVMSLGKAKLTAATHGGPQFDAPSDAGVALRGLRTVGLKEGAVARIGGTSAAAPLVARHIADYLYRKHVMRIQDGGSGALPRELTKPTYESGPAEEKIRRPTATPTRDDRTQRGARRLVPRRR